MDMNEKFEGLDTTITQLTEKNEKQATQMTKINDDMAGAKEQQTAMSALHDTDISNLDKRIDGLNYHRPGK